MMRFVAAGPSVEVGIDVALVRRLLAAQHPDLADMELVHVGRGWDNELYHLGEDMLVRLPRRAVAEPLILHERRWLGVLAPGLPLPVPIHVRDGAAGEGYPWAWAVVPWFAGDVWERTPPDDIRRAAGRLGEFLAALHTPAAADAPSNPYRGRPLVERAERFTATLEQLDGVVDVDRCRECFAELAAARPVGPPTALVARRPPSVEPRRSGRPARRGDRLRRPLRR